jgi:hypothetical protein
MRALSSVFATYFASGLVLAGLSSCAYQRYATPLHLELNPKLAGNAAPAGMYAFRLINAEVPPTKMSGLSWDEDGTGPDPFVRLIIDGRKVWESEAKQDQARPEWNVVLPHNVVIHSNSQFRLELWDRDTTVSADPIGQIEHRGLPVNAVPDAQARLQLDRATVTIMVSAPQAHKGVGLSVEARPDALKVIAVEPYSPASRAGIRVGEMIVGVGSERVSHMGPNDAVSEVSLAAERAHKLVVADGDRKSEREVTLDQGYVWVIM